MTTLGYQMANQTNLRSNGAEFEVDVARDFSDTPGGRYRKYGPHSGEEFRQNVLAPRFRQALEHGESLRVRIDRVKRSYQVSFLDEAFAGLVRDEGFSKFDVSSYLVIVSDTARFEKYKELAKRYISEA